MVNLTFAQAALYFLDVAINNASFQLLAFENEFQYIERSERISA